MNGGAPFIWDGALAIGHAAGPGLSPGVGGMGVWLYSVRRHGEDEAKKIKGLGKNALSQLLLGRN